MPGAAARGAAREAAEASVPDISMEEAERLAPFSKATGNLYNVFANIALDAIEKARRRQPRPKPNPRVMQRDEELPNRNDESGAPRGPGRFIKYAQFLTNKQKERKQRLREQRGTPGPSGRMVDRTGERSIVDRVPMKKARVKKVSDPPPKLTPGRSVGGRR
jgi:hypothetical protein